MSNEISLVTEKKIGKGSYGIVYESTVNGKKIATKKINNIFKSTTTAKRICREILILKCLYNCDNIVKLTDISLPPESTKDNFDTINLAFEYHYGCLQTILFTRQKFTDLHVKYIMYQILNGLHNMHSMEIIHRDLKPSNILIDGNCKINICDFGLSKLSQTNTVSSPTNETESSNALDTTNIVTRWYRAPEVILLSNKHTSKLDIWSAGCIMAELLSLQLKHSNHVLFQGKSCFPISGKDDSHQNSDDQLNVIFNVLGTPSIEDINEIDNLTAKLYLSNILTKSAINLELKYKDANPIAIDLLKKLLVFNPKKRISALEAMNDPYFNNVREPIIYINPPEKEYKILQEFETYIESLKPKFNMSCNTNNDLQEKERQRYIKENNINIDKNKTEMFKLIRNYMIPFSTNPPNITCNF